MLCPDCKRGVISYYRYRPWCGTNVRGMVADSIIEKGRDITVYAKDTGIRLSDETAGCRVLGKCPKCGEELSLGDISVETWYTDEGALLNSNVSVFGRHMLVCKKCGTIIGFSG
ncbi:MAG: hypothetical protein JSW61_02040 [Candidatus Thorarchaeota archaeon]|nr:MAG: hypothetical protein JSW61_02040 [Candidatus Thorarchaeota archaeon]